MPSSLSSLVYRFPHVGITSVIDIVIVACLIYQLIMIIRGRRAAPIFIGIVLLIVAYNVATYAGLELLRSILSFVVPYTAIALIVLFQSDIRRTLARLGRTQWVLLKSRYLDREAIGEILLALQKLSQERTGALVVVERAIGLRTFIESGVALNAHLSVDLLISIFRSASPLHDGAVIIQGNKIAAASCFLPLSMNPNLSRMLGTRHRAAIGVTEESDSISVIVSEETGHISVAAFGEIEMNVPLERVEERLRNVHQRSSGGGHGGEDSGPQVKGKQPYESRSSRREPLEEEVELS